MASDLSKPDLLVIQIDGLHTGNELVNLIKRGLDPKVCRLFIINGAKGLGQIIRRTFGAHTRSSAANS